MIFNKSYETKIVFVQVLITPLFVVRSHLPLPLIMNVHTPRIRATQQVEIDGQGQDHQLWPIGGDLTHSVTFQLGWAVASLYIVIETRI